MEYGWIGSDSYLRMRRNACGALPSPGVTLKRIVSAESPATGSATVTIGDIFAAPFQSPRSLVAQALAAASRFALRAQPTRHLRCGCISNIAATFSAAHLTASSPSRTVTATLIAVPSVPLVPCVPSSPTTTSSNSTFGLFSNKRSAPNRYAAAAFVLATTTRRRFALLLFFVATVRPARNRAVCQRTNSAVPHRTPKLYQIAAPGFKRGVYGITAFMGSCTGGANN